MLVNKGVTDIRLVSPHKQRSYFRQSKSSVYNDLQVFLPTASNSP